MAVTTRNIPVPIFPADTPEFDQGETEEKPIALPNANKTRVRAAAAMPPAAIAAQETAD
jgi:hypothetical protein